MKTFKELREACWTGYKRKKGTKAYEPGSCVKEDGEGGGAASAGPTNVVGGGAIAGTGGAGGEPGVNLKKRKTPVMFNTFKRKPPKI
jgi:hypothetical protein